MTKKTHQLIIFEERSSGNILIYGGLKDKNKLNIKLLLHPISLNKSTSMDRAVQYEFITSVINQIDKDSSGC